MLPFNVYRCPEGHQTDSFATFDPKLDRPSVTELTCKVKDHTGTPCRKRATFVETRRTANGGRVVVMEQEIPGGNAV